MHCHNVRPFLGPVYAWVAQLPQGLVATLPLSICLLLEFIKKEVERAPMTAPKPLMSHVKDVFRIDAKAEGDKICVGGWESFSGDTQRARWFSVRLDKKSAPWAYVKGEPFRAIAALELVATLVAVCVFGPGAAWRECAATAVIAGFTDNAGNTFVVDKMMTTAFPLSIILMELAAQLDALGSVLSLSWVPARTERPCGRADERGVRWLRPASAHQRRHLQAWLPRFAQVDGCSDAAGQRNSHGKGPGQSGASQASQDLQEAVAPQ